MNRQQTLTMIDQLRDWADVVEEETGPSWASLQRVVDGMREVAADLEREDDALENWDRDEYQFPRLLAEIQANCGLAEVDALLHSMDISRAQLDELFDRAHDAWERVKEATCPPGE